MVVEKSPLHPKPGSECNRLITSTIVEWAGPLMDDGLRVSSFHCNPITAQMCSFSEGGSNTLGAAHQFPQTCRMNVVTLVIASKPGLESRVLRSLAEREVFRLIGHTVEPVAFDCLEYRAAHRKKRTAYKVAAIPSCRQR